MNYEIKKKRCLVPTKPKIFIYGSPLQKNILTPENVTKETRKISEENTGEPKGGEVLPNDSNPEARWRKTDKFDDRQLKPYL